MVACAALRASKRAVSFRPAHALLSSARMPEGLAAFLDALSRAVHVASDLVWGPWTMALLLGSGLFLTLRYRFVQVTRFREAAWP